KEDLSLAYTPGVAAVCKEIGKDRNKSYALTEIQVTKKQMINLKRLMKPMKYSVIRKNVQNTNNWENPTINGNNAVEMIPILIGMIG
ncbi:MAG: hypothetical protein HGB14_09460, partial [Anaerolineaceae bacterium]|nr:hypothetical protein [Anaerolineaceae bacterium]